MEIVDNHDQGMNGRDLLAEIEQLSFHSPRFSRARMRNFAIPRWRCVLHDLTNLWFVSKHAQSLDPWYKRLAVRQRLGASAARQVKRLLILKQIGNEKINKRGLSQTGITTDANQASMAFARQIIRAAKLLPFAFASHD